MTPLRKTMGIVLTLTLFGLWPMSRHAAPLPGIAGTAWAAEYLKGEGGDDVSEEPGITVPDPWESFNRKMFIFNDRLYFYVLKPAATVYKGWIPTGVRTAVNNAFDNIAFPVRFLNNTFQGKFEGAGIETGRFLINSTMGVGGLFDVAARNFDLKPRNEDFGQTLGYYGMKPTIYIVWPIFGPSTLRDTIGLGADVAGNPLYWLSPGYGESTGIRAGGMLNETSLVLGEYEDFKASAIDPYVSMRDAYINYRENRIKK